MYDSGGDQHDTAVHHLIPNHGMLATRWPLHVTPLPHCDPQNSGRTFTGIVLIYCARIYDPIRHSGDFFIAVRQKYYHAPHNDLHRDTCTECTGDIYKVTRLARSRDSLEPSTNHAGVSYRKLTPKNVQFCVRGRSHWSAPQKYSATSAADIRRIPLSIDLLDRKKNAATTVARLSLVA